MPGIKYIDEPHESSFESLCKKTAEQTKWHNIGLYTENC